MKLITLLMLAYIAMPMSLFAKQVSVEEAKTVAKNFFYQQTKSNSGLDYESISLKVNYIENSGNTYFYVFNLEGMDGFVITSAQDFIQPILGFSDQNNVDFTNLSPELKYLLDGYKDQIKFGIDNNAKASSRITTLWQNLQIPSMNRTSVIGSQGPLMMTTWNQSPYYNEMCPSNSSGEHAVVGCVAVAMAQVMKYYNYPNQGTGSKSYYDYSGLTHSANIDYSDHTYYWDNMPSSLSESNEDLAKLMYHCGHSVKMDWEVDGSGTQSDLIAVALKQYFGYANTAIEYSRTGWSGTLFTDSEWEEMIRNELDALRPIVYSGFASGASAGHAWNCDGYQSDGDGGFFYHMNYGWGGYGNGYFALNNLIAESVPGGDDELFNAGHQIIIGMYPGDAFPYHCSDNRLVTGSEGVIGDGSGPENYEHNLDCHTIIQSTCERGKTTVIFENFDLAEGDALYIYDGITLNDPVIAILSSENLPDGAYVSNNNGMLIRLVTNSTGSGKGWDARYYTASCGLMTTHQALGEISDGSGLCDYEPSQNCYFNIEPEGASQIILNFTEFDLDGPDKDYVKVFDGETDDLLDTWYGSDTPPSNYTVNSSKVKLRFRSYSDGNVGEGWKLNFTSDVVGIDDVIRFDELVSIYPNPFSGDASIEIQNPESREVEMSVLDITGRKIMSKDFGILKNTNLIQLSELGDINFETGVYLLNVKIGNQNKTFKLISE